MKSAEMLGISVHPDVEDKDLDEIFRFIAEDDLEAAKRVVMGITKTIEFLGQYPDLGSAYSHKHPKLQGIYKHTAVKIPGKSYRNYLIFYRIEPDHIRILYVFRVSRQIPERMVDELRF